MKPEIPFQLKDLKPKSLTPIAPEHQIAAYSFDFFKDSNRYTPYLFE